jgi:cellulose synthase/poly-beta-1,6-N-acetylglucosamine synthase-like glycosyltransferase
MPKRILIIGLVFCLGGIHATWEMLSALMDSRIFLDVGALMLPVGIGLLRGRARSRWWARVWILIGYAICAIALVIALFNPQSVSISWPAPGTRGIPALPYAFACLFLAFLTLHIMQRLLDSRKSREWFGTGSRHTPGYQPFT